MTPHVRLVAPLSRGAMGEIWVADHLTLATPVAVKLIVGELAGVTLAWERFEREARLAAQLDTPHVVRHFDHGITEGGSRYIVMELLRGQALDERCHEGSLDLADTLQILEEVGSALECAARRGIVHRDVKPENIFLCEMPPGFFCKLLDFGVSSEPKSAPRRSLTLPGALVGTPSHMSPEMVLGTRGAHHQDDLWGLATVAYECLLGTEPFRGLTVGAICAAIVSRQYARPSDCDRAIGPCLDGFFARAFAEQPTDRFDAVSEMLVSLRLALRDGGPRSSSVVTVSPVSAADDRQPAVADRFGDTLPSIESVELAAGVVPFLRPPWASVVVGATTLAILALPLAFRPHAGAGRAASGWATLAAEAAPPLSSRGTPAAEARRRTQSEPAAETDDRRTAAPTVRGRVSSSDETKHVAPPARGTSAATARSDAATPIRSTGSASLIPPRDLGF